MGNRIFRLDRRELMAGMGATALAPALPGTAEAGLMALRPGQQDTPIWTLRGAGADRFRRGDEIGIELENNLPVPMVLNWVGLDGVPAAEPLAARPPLAPGARESLVIPLRHAGTLLCDIRLLGDGQARPAGVLALISGESAPV